MALIVKTWHRIVRLRCKVCARDPTCCQRLEYRKASAAQQAVNERGDKHSFAGVRKPGNTKPNRRIEQMAAELDECSSGEPNLFNELKHSKGSRLYAAVVHRRCKASGNGGSGSSLPALPQGGAYTSERAVRVGTHAGTPPLRPNDRSGQARHIRATAHAAPCVSRTAAWRTVDQSASSPHGAGAVSQR